MSNLLAAILFGFFGYLVGGIPTAHLVAKRKQTDLRTKGSGNLGATNTSRTLGFRYGVMVGILDLLKGVLPSLLALLFSSLSITALLCIGLSTILGHIYTPYLASHRGGKGVATGAGVIAVLFPSAIVAGLVVFFSVAYATRYISLASMTTYGVLIPCYLLLNSIQGQSIEYARLVFLVLLALLILFTHRTNIQRLMHHTEPKFSFSADKEHA